MKFQKFVSRTTKGIFLFLVVIMAVTLVMSGTMGGTPDQEGDAEAGVIFEDVRVSMRDYNLHLHKATPAYWWNNLWKEALGPMARFRRPRVPERPKEEQLHRQAWENIILLEDARRKGIVATRMEADLRIRDLIDTLGRGQLQRNDEGLQQVASSFFHTSATVFQSWVADQVIIDKLLDLAGEGEFCDFERVYAEALKGSRLARVWAASFDPKDFARDLKPVRTAEVSKYYEAHKERFKTPDKIQITYLMAEYEEFKKKVSDPSEEDLRKYYEDHRGEYLKPDEHAPGEEHRDDEPPQYRSFEEVREELPDKVRLEKARLEARKVMARIDKEIGAAFKDDQYPENLFDEIKARYGREGITLVHDVTGAFDAKHVEDVEKIIGENSGLKDWGFETGRKAGEISKRFDTSKGSLFCRIQKRIDAYDPGLTEPVRKTIEKALEKEQLQRRARAAADAAVQEILKHGFAEARRNASAEWRPSRYFGARGGGDAGLDEPALGHAVMNQIRQGQMSLEKRTSVIPGSMVSWAADKRDWSYAVYLEDLVEEIPEDLEGEFRSQRAAADMEAREKYRQAFVTRTVALANLKDLTPKKKEEPEAPKS